MPPKLLSIDEAAKSVPPAHQLRDLDMAGVAIDFGKNTINSLKASPDVIQRLVKQTGAPVSFFMDCSQSLRTSILQERLKGRSRILSLGDEVIQLMQETGPYLEPRDVFSALAEATKVPEVSIEVTETGGLVADFVVADGLEAKTVGDIVRGGFTYETDFDGGIQTHAVGLFAWRMVCSNGMLGREDRLKKVQESSDTEIMAELRSRAIQCMQSSREQMVPVFLETQNHKVDHPELLLQSFISRMSLGRAMRDALQNAAATIGPEPTMYDFINMVTSVVNTSPIRRFRRSMQRVVGATVLDKTVCCTLCKRPL